MSNLTPQQQQEAMAQYIANNPHLSQQPREKILVSADDAPGRQPPAPRTVQPARTAQPTTRITAAQAMAMANTGLPEQPIPNALTGPPPTQYQPEPPQLEIEYEEPPYEQPEQFDEIALQLMELPPDLQTVLVKTIEELGFSLETPENVFLQQLIRMVNELSANLDNMNRNVEMMLQFQRQLMQKELEQANRPKELRFASPTPAKKTNAKKKVKRKKTTKKKTN
jgi:hypothetical protein